MKKKYEFKSIVAETLLIPLYMRAKEIHRQDAILRDRQAEQLVESIEYDYSKFDGAKLSAVGCVVRGLYFDNAIRRFIATHRNPVVVNVGCGLDTRYQRIEEPQIRSGLKDGHEVEVWEPRLQLIEQALYQKFFPKRWGFGGMLMGKFPGICKKFSSLLGYQIK